MYAYLEFEFRKRVKILVADNDREHRDKTEKRKASRREHMQKKRASEAFRKMEKKRAKILVADNDTEQRDKAEKCKASKREHMQRKRANAANRKTENKISDTETNGSGDTTKTVKLLDTDNDTIVDAECMVNQFHDDIRCGPEYICTWCDQ